MTYLEMLAELKNNYNNDIDYYKMAKTVKQFIKTDLTKFQNFEIVNDEFKNKKYKCWIRNINCNLPFCIMIIINLNEENYERLIDSFMNIEYRFTQDSNDKVGYKKQYTLLKVLVQESINLYQCENIRLHKGIIQLSNELIDVKNIRELANLLQKAIKLNLGDCTFRIAIDEEGNNFVKLPVYNMTFAGLLTSQEREYIESITSDITNMSEEERKKIVYIGFH